MRRLHHLITQAACINLCRAASLTPMSRKARVSAALLDLLRQGEQHAWTLEELHAGLARSGRATDFSSVFRAAEKLAADGMARKLLLDDGKARFELAAAHHD